MMDVFAVRDQLISDYRAFTSGYVDVRDRRIAEHVARELDAGVQWPDPWLSLNPSFASGGSIDELVTAGLLHPECERIFRVKENEADPGTRLLTLHRHQREAIEAARTGAGYVLTTGTGSGKSLAYIVPIVDRVLREGSRRGVKAIIVYPMNALANSQRGELEKFLRFGYGQDHEPVTFARYTGQESAEEREAILKNPPDILLTNYVMLELVLTRPDERKRLIRAARGLQFLVLDELHTYRGRQGADVALLARRLRDACESPNLQCVGTSATMASAGTVEEQKGAVAEVATRLFGADVTPERVIGETLERATSGGSSSKDALARAVRTSRSTWTYDELAADPLAAWIEDTFGLAVDAIGRLRRRPPTTVQLAAGALAGRIGESPEACAAAIRATLQAGSRVRHPGTHRPLFAFRLHQFLSKGDTVYVSFEPEAERHITSHYQQVVPGEPGKLLLPLAFCRECGQEYVVVARTTRDGQPAFVSRRDRDASGGDDANGYLYVSDDLPWPADPIQDARLPDSWLTEVAGEVEVVPSRRARLPVEVWVGPDGVERSRGAGLRAAYVPSPFAFCLRCKVSYEQVRGRDFSKLATLDAEGRSSAMSTIGGSVVRSLKAVDDPDFSPEARKLLTFVDNRQDASLQAGHFNDFVQVTQLRGALYRAAAAAPDGLRQEVVAQRVAEALGLDFADFAQNPQAKFSARETAQRALREYVAYRLYLDLERGWRITMPNLEQVGLLKVDYLDLEQIAADDDCWVDTHAALRDASSGLRNELGRILLDELRRVLAIQVDCLTPEGFEQLQNLSRQHLIGPWSMPEREFPPNAGVAFPRPGRPGGQRRDLNLSGRSAFGRYLCRTGRFPETPGIKTDDARLIIQNLLEVLEQYAVLTSVVEPRDGGGVAGYRLKASAIIWRAGDGTAGADDPIRRTFDDESAPRVNGFFRDLYRNGSAGLVGLHAAEHTAQVPARDREERETAFRKGTLPLLFCSPTMELGVDIATLNAVGLRNVPPTPANYAQRSGRAGRSGQPALVVTYCATGNSHDQYYFRRSAAMVAGSVAAPRLDLGNEDLVRSHLHAIWLAETGVSLHSSLDQLLDVAGESPTLALLPEVGTALDDAHARRRAADRARDVLAGSVDDLAATTWWDETWVERVIERAPRAFDDAGNRWRDLYRGALAEQAQQNRIVLDQSVSKKDRDIATTRRREAETQLRLLRNEEPGQQGQGDFYSYRYFASEGFLPGYSFPRLPLAAYIPGSRAKLGNGDYLQRPRFLAISEFGPGALIYHEGARYEVVRIQLPRGKTEDAPLDTEQARRCDDCGYHHVRQAGLDLCENCGAHLTATTGNLLRLQTVFTRRRERISSDEEERRRAGFELHASYRFNDHGARPGRIDADVADPTGSQLARLTYGGTATVRITNMGRLRRKEPENVGYWIDSVDGRWLTEKQAADRTPDDDGLGDVGDVARKQQVIPYVEDTRNILISRLVDTVDEPTAVTLQYALERGIEARFQLEDSELSSLLLPDPDSRARTMFTESAEGGAGVLRRLIDEPDALAAVARQALEIAHFDPDSGDDRGDRAAGGERCERACYDCLLSYANQLDHAVIDRHRVRDILLELAAARTAVTGPGRSPAEQLATLGEHADSELERDFLKFLAGHDYRLPDETQVLVAEALARPDFVYRLGSGPTAVFVDGPVHDAASVRERDAGAEDRLMDLGWNVVRVRYDEDWSSVVARNVSVFGEGK